MLEIGVMLEQLHHQREQLDRLIAAAEDYARGARKRRGRPPKWMQHHPKRRGRPPGSKNKTQPVALSSSKAS